MVLWPVRAAEGGAPLMKRLVSPPVLKHDWKVYPQSGSGAADPKVTESTLDKLVPYSCTWVPPKVGPLLGATALMVGRPGTTKVKRSALVVELVVDPITLMSTVPLPVGVFTPIMLSVLTVKHDPGPKLHRPSGGAVPNCT